MTDFTIGIHTDDGITEVQTEGDMTDTVPSLTNGVAMFRVLSYEDEEKVVEFQCRIDDFAYLDRGPRSDIEEPTEPSIESTERTDV